MEENGGLAEPRATSVEPVLEPPEPVAGDTNAGDRVTASAAGGSALPVDRSDEWTGWKPVIVIVAVLGVLPVLVLAVAYIAHLV